MKILAINTTNAFGEICINNDGIITKAQIQNPYSEHIMNSLQSIMENCNLSINDIDAFGIVTGPGSFTGIRIGMSVLKGLLCGIKRPLVSINAFDLISHNIQDKNYVVVLDSGNSDCYYAICENKVAMEMQFGNVEDILKFANQNGLKVYFNKDEFEKFGEYSELVPVEIDKNTLANIVFEKAKNNDFITIEKLSPIYIKLSQAEIGLEKQMKEHLSFAVANQNDVSMLEVIDKQCFDEYERYSANMFLEEVTEKTKRYFVAKYDDLIIGYVGLQNVSDELSLLKIAVLPQYRKLGVGFKLMELSFDFKKECNANSYFLEVRESNESAIKLYQKFGFKVQGKRENYYDGKETAIVMVAK